MHKTMTDAGRQYIKELLAKCTEPQQRMFKLMYGRDKGRRSVEDTEKMNINDVVDEVQEERLNTAIDQCERTVKKNESVPTKQ